MSAEVLEKYSHIPLKDDVRLKFNELVFVEDPNTNKLYKAILQVDQDKDWLLEKANLILDSNSLDKDFLKKDFEIYAEKRFDRQVLFEEIVNGGYEKVKSGKLNQLMDQAWIKINSQIRELL